MNQSLEYNQKIALKGLKNLSVGLLMRVYEKESTEPENVATNRESFDRVFYSRQWQYCHDLDRVLKELKLTEQLINSVETQDQLPDGYKKQDLVIYYQGVYLGLVHQIKDKIFQIVNLITEAKTPAEPNKEKSKAKVKSVLKNKATPIEEMGIRKELAEWDDKDSDSVIAIALRLRRQHHHQTSNLPLNKDFQQMTAIEMFLDPASADFLSDYGKKRLSQLQKESSQRFFADARSKAKSTTEAIEENIEKVSTAIVTYYSLPAGEKDVAEIMSRYQKMMNSLEISNQCSLDKIPQYYKEKLKKILQDVEEATGVSDEAVYLVGSLCRGDYQEDISDINLYVILAADSSRSEEAQISGSISFAGLDLRGFFRNQFKSDKNKKYRFIAHHDGVLLKGNDLIGNEVFPKPGAHLALLLNGDHLKNLDELTAWIEAHLNATPYMISEKSKYLAKGMIDFIYGVVIANKPQFSFNREERIQAIIDMYPENKKSMDSLAGVVKYGVGDLDSLRNMIEGNREQVMKNIAKLEALQETAK